MRSLALTTYHQPVLGLMAFCGLASRSAAHQLKLARTTPNRTAMARAAPHGSTHVVPGKNGRSCATTL